MSKTFSQADVASHNKPDNLWVVIDEDVYDLTKFQDEHPGKLSRIVSRIHKIFVCETNAMRIGGKKST